MAAATSLRMRPAGPEEKLLKWLDQIEMEGEHWRGKALRDADRYERLFQGQRKYDGARRLPRFKADVIGPTIRRRNALLTENKPVFKIDPMIDGLQATSEVLTQLAEFAWSDHGFQGAIEEMVELASVFRAAGMSLPFDFSADGGLGSVEAVPRDPRQVLIDPNTKHARDVGTRAKYTMIETVEAIWDIQHDFPGRGMEVKPETGVSSYIKSPLSYGVQSDQQGSLSFRDHIKKLQEGPIPRCRKKVYFIRDPALLATGGLRYPLGRMVVRAGDIILADEPSPFFDGEPDLVWFENRREFGSVWGNSEVEALRYLQGAVNRIGEMFVNNTVLMGNSRVVMDNDALSNEAVQKLTNAEALVVSKKRMSTIDWQPPPPMPPHFLQFISFALRLVDYLVGLNDGQLEGRGRVEMRSGVQLEGLQNAAQVLIRALARRLEEFMERMGRKFISRVLQFYNKERILLATGPGGQFQKYKLETDKLFAEINEVAFKRAEKGGKFEDHLRDLKRNAAASMAFKVQPLSSLATTKVARTQLLIQLVEGAMLPREIILREVGYNNVDELLQKATAEHAQMAQLGIGQQKTSKGKKGKGATG